MRPPCLESGIWQEHYADWAWLACISILCELQPGRWFYNPKDIPGLDEYVTDRLADGRQLYQ